MMKLKIFLKTLVISSLIMFHASFAEETIEIIDENGVEKKCNLFENGTIVCM